jgi:hypothetical protein
MSVTSSQLVQGNLYSHDHKQLIVHLERINQETVIATETSEFEVMHEFPTQFFIDNFSDTGERFVY